MRISLLGLLFIRLVELRWSAYPSPLSCGRLNSYVAVDDIFHFLLYGQRAPRQTRPARFSFDVLSFRFDIRHRPLTYHDLIYRTYISYSCIYYVFVHFYQCQDICQIFFLGSRSNNCLVASLPSQQHALFKTLQKLWHPAQPHSSTPPVYFFSAPTRSSFSTARRPPIPLARGP